MTGAVTGVATGVSQRPCKVVESAAAGANHASRPELQGVSLSYSASSESDLVTSNGLSVSDEQFQSSESSSSPKLCSTVRTSSSGTASPKVRESLAIVLRRAALVLCTERSVFARGELGVQEEVEW